MSLRCVPTERPHVKRENANRGAQSAQLEIKADREERIIPAANGGTRRDYHLGEMEAKRLRGKAEALAAPTSEAGRLVKGCGEAVAVEPGGFNSANGGSALAYIVDTLETPTSVSVEASEQRMRPLVDLGVLQSGLDAAQTADAKT